MPELPISESHIEALNRANTQTQELVKSAFSVERLRAFIDEYAGPEIEVQAVYPVLNSIKAELGALIRKYDLCDPVKRVFLASPHDAHTLETLFDFLSFLTLNLYFKARYRRLPLLMDIDPLHFFLSANLEVANAAMRLSLLSALEFQQDSGIAVDLVSHRLLEDLRNHQVVPFSGTLSVHVSDYAVFMSRSVEGQTHGTGGQNGLNQKLCEGNNTQPQESMLAQIQKGMQQLPRDQWPQLVFECRKQAAIAGTCDEKERELLVGYDILASLCYEQLFYYIHEASSPYCKTYRFAHILDPELLRMHPGLSKYAVSVLRRLAGLNSSDRHRIDERVRDGELLVAALQDNNAPLISAVLDFYSYLVQQSFYEDECKTLTPMGNLVVLEHLEKLTRNHLDLRVQVSLLQVLVNSMKIEKSYDFAPAEEYTAVVQTFLSMLKFQLEFSSEWLDLEIQKGLLSVIALMLENDSSGVLTIANDSLSLHVLASAVSGSHVGLQPLAIKCLVCLVDADLLLYSIIESYGLWDSIIEGVRDPYALVQLYACLITSEQGLKLVQKYALRDRLIDTALEYCFGPNMFSQDYYSSLTDAIVSDPPTLAAFGDRLPEFISRVLEYLDNHADESCFDIEHRFWGRRSETTNLVIHLVHLLSSTAHRDVVRSKLHSATGLPLLLQIFAHKHLPFVFPNTLRSQVRFNTLINELFLTDTAQSLLSFLFQGLRDVLESNTSCPNTQRMLQVYSACLLNLNFKKPEEFTTKLIEWVTSDSNFISLATLLPKASAKTAAQVYDLLCGTDKEIFECFWYRSECYWSHNEAHMSQMSELVLKERLGTPNPLYFQKKCVGVLARQTGAIATHMWRTLLQFLNELAREQMIPESFDPTIFARGMIDCWLECDLSCTRGRYVLLQLNPKLYLNCWSVNGLMKAFFVERGIEAVIDLYTNLHGARIADAQQHKHMHNGQDEVLVSAYTRSDCFEKCNSMIKEVLHECGLRGSIPKKISEQCTAANYSPMQAWAHLIKCVVDYNIPIINEFFQCWHCDEQDLSAHLPLREYLLNNLQGFFKNQEITGYRIGSKMVALTLYYLEVYEPIMADLLPRLIKENTGPALAVVAGCYTFGEMRNLMPKLPRIDSLLLNIAENDPIKAMCSAQIILHSGSELPKHVTQDLIKAILGCKSPRTLAATLELASRCVIVHPEEAPLPATIDQVQRHCLKVFETDDYEFDSILGLAILEEFVIVCLEADSAVLEATMAGVVSIMLDKAPKPLSELQLKLSKLNKRSPTALKNALGRHSMVLNEEALVPRSLVWEAHELPRICGKVGQLSIATKQLIDQCIDEMVERAPQVINCLDELSRAQEASDHLYSNQPLEDAYRTDFTAKQKEIDAAYIEAWSAFRKAVFGIRLYSDTLEYLAYFYGPSAVYMLENTKFDTLLRLVLEIAGHISVITQYEVAYPVWRIQTMKISEFILNLLKCGPEIAQKLFKSFESILNGCSSPQYACLGILCVGTPIVYDSDWMKPLKESAFLEKISEIIANEGPESVMFSQLRWQHRAYYDRLSSAWGGEMELYTSFTKKLGENEHVHEDENEPDDEDEEDEDDRSGAASLIQSPVPAYLDFSEASDTSESEDISGNASTGASSSSISYGSDQEEDEDDEDFYSDYRDSLFAETDVINVGSPFDIGNFFEYAKAHPRIIFSWNVNVSHSASENATLEHSYTYSPPLDREPLFFEEESALFLGQRKLGLAPRYLPGHPKYIPARKPLFSHSGVTSSLQRLNSNFGFFSGDDPKGLRAAEQMMRPWLQGNGGPIDWPSVPRLECDKSLRLPEPEAPVSSDTQDVDANDKETTECIAYEFAIEKGRHLLENPEELPQWGLSSDFLEGLPEDYKLDALISYLTLNCGEEMTGADIRATFDEDLVYDIAMTSREPNPVAVSAQFSKDDSTANQLEFARFHEKPVHPKVTEHLFLGFTTRTSAKLALNASIPAFTGDKQLENDFLCLFRDLLASNSPLVWVGNVDLFITWLHNSKNGNLDVAPLIDCLSSPVVLSHTVLGLSQLISTLKESVQSIKYPTKLEDSAVEKLFSTYCSSFLSPFKRKTLKQIILQMVERGFANKSTLEKIVCEQLMSELTKCNQEIRRGGASDLTSLEDLLSALAGHPLVNITDTRGIVQQAIEMGKNVSEIIQNHEITTTISLLRCYLMLVTLTPDARAAFIAFVEQNRRLVNKIILQDHTMLKSCFANMKGNYHLLDFKVRVGIIRGRYPQNSETANRLSIGRDRIFQDSYTAVEGLDPRKFANSTFKVDFKAEMGFDGGGLTKEWLTVLARSVAESEYGLFTRVGDKLHPNAQCCYEGNSKLYMFIGKMMAKSVLLKEAFDCNLSSVVYSSIVSKKPGPFSLNDLYEFDRDLAQSLEWVLENDVTGVIMETFVTRGSAFGDLKIRELKPGGALVEVTEENKHEYVELMIRHVLYQNVEHQIQAICQGFWSVIPLSLVNILSPTELRDLLCGAQTIDVDEWQAATIYQTYNSSSTTIKYFWQAVRSLSESEQRQLLLFATGSDRVSALGFASGGTKFTVGKQYDNGSNSGNSAMPTSSTCISLLNLPEYRSYEEAVTSLRRALEYGSLGFGFN